MTYTLTRPTGELAATPEQVTIIDAARNTKDNLLINALAGAAKSTTLEFICKYLPVAPILSLAFNKRIATELASRLPGHVSCKTLNALGHQIWGTAVGKRLTLQIDKDRQIFRNHVEQFPRREQSDWWECVTEINACLRYASTSGWLPAGAAEPYRGLISDEDFRDQIDYEVFDEPCPDWIFSYLRQHMKTRIEMAYAGIIDFNDQLYMPTLFGGTFPRFPTVMVDEAQDLSRLNHQFLTKLVTQRLIAVGDPYQSIYGFRGAVSNGMANLRQRFSMTEFTLSYSFRCPRAVIRKAQSRVAHMRWPDWAPEGLVQFHPRDEPWLSTSIPDGAAIICRNNAPLFRTALNLIKLGRGVTLVGADIGPGLVKLLRKLGPEGTPAEAVHGLIDKWEADGLAKARNKASIVDRAECLRVFAEQGPTLAAAIAYAEVLFASAGPIQLMSGHKSKGLEFDVVYHLDPWRIPGKFATTQEELDQEYNLLYVIETRTRRELHMVNAEQLQ